MSIKNLFTKKKTHMQSISEEYAMSSVDRRLLERSKERERLKKLQRKKKIKKGIQRGAKLTVRALKGIQEYAQTKDKSIYLRPTMSSKRKTKRKTRKRSTDHVIIGGSKYVKVKRRSPKAKRTRPKYKRTMW